MLKLVREHFALKKDYLHIIGYDICQG